jgi:ribosome maturation factor RimP
MELKEQIGAWLKPLLEEQNLFLVDVKASGKAKIEVFADGDHGITISQCAELSRYLEQYLDGSGLVSDTYTLDVSSPGMDNPLKVPRQYKKRIGRTLHVIKTDGTEVEAELIAADDEKIRLKEIAKPEKKKKKGIKAEQRQEPKEFELKYTDIKKAVIQIDWSKIKAKKAELEESDEDAEMDVPEADESELVNEN